MHKRRIAYQRDVMVQGGETHTGKRKHVFGTKTDILEPIRERIYSLGPERLHESSFVAKSG